MVKLTTLFNSSVAGRSLLTRRICTSKKLVVKAWLYSSDCETPWPSGHGGNELGHPEGGCRGWQEKKCIGRT